LAWGRPWPTARAHGRTQNRVYGPRNSPITARGERGEEGVLTAGKIGGGDGSGTAGRAEVRSAAGGASPCGGCGQERGENWSGGSRGRARGGSAPICSGRGARGALPRCTERGRRLLRRRARAVAELRGEGDGADRWGPGVSGWEEGGAAMVASRPFGWAGPRCWAERGGEASWAGAGAGLRC